MEFVQVEHLTKTYADGSGERTVLRDVSFSLCKGEITAMIGASGSGKSTLLHLLGGLDTPTSGTIRIDDIELTSQTDPWRTEFRRKNIGMIYQFFNLIPLLTVRENLLLSRIMEGDWREDEDFRNIVECLRLEDCLDDLPAKLSGGQQQRVAVGRAILMHPLLVLADEPTGNLDSANSTSVMELLQKLCRDHGQTALVVTHDTQIAAQCDRVLMMQDGKVIQNGVGE